MDLTTPGAIHMRSEDGRSIWFGEAVYTFKATGRSTDGALTLADASVPPGNGPPLHVHARADETFLIRDGSVEFTIEDETVIAGPGDFVFVPHGVRHRFENVGLHVARLVFMFTPGGMDEYFTGIGVDAIPGRTPGPLTEAQFQRIVDDAPRHGLTIVPPGEVAQTPAPGPAHTDATEKERTIV